MSDLVEASAMVRSELDGVPIEALETDRRKSWVVERGIEIVSEAGRHLPEALKARHPAIAWRKVAGIGNISGHE